MNILTDFPVLPTEPNLFPLYLIVPIIVLASLIIWMGLERPGISQSFLSVQFILAGIGLILLDLRIYEGIWFMRISICLITVGVIIGIAAFFKKGKKYLE